MKTYKFISNPKTRVDGVNFYICDNGNPTTDIQSNEDLSGTYYRAEDVEEERLRNARFHLKIRDAIVEKDYEEAYHFLYELCNSEYPIEPWKDQEELVEQFKNLKGE